MSRSFGGGFLIAIAGGTSVEEVRHGSIRRVVKDFGGPTGLAALPDGGAVVSSQFRYEIVRSTPGGDLSTIAGTGEFGITPDGEPAAGNPIGSPLDVARLPDGDVVFSEYAGDYPAIREIRPDGTLETLAGGPGLGFGGDGGPAVDATLGLVYDLAVEADGGILIADDHRVRRIGTDGIIETVAGTGETRYNGDRIAATEANLFPPSLSATNDGGFLIGDFGNGRIRRVAPDGEIRTIAGMPAPCICEKARYNGIQGEPRRDEIRGQKRRDLIRGETGDDDLGGRGGDDCIAGGLDDDELDGGSKGDGIDAENGNDRVAGGKGDDAIDGQGGHDSPPGRGGDDRVYGGFDDDHLVGGKGDDLLDGNTGPDHFEGEGGNDYIDAQYNERESSQPRGRPDRLRPRTRHGQGQHLRPDRPGLRGHQGRRRSPRALRFSRSSARGPAGACLEANRDECLGLVAVVDRVAAGGAWRGPPRRSRELEGAAIPSAGAERVRVAAGLAAGDAFGPLLVLLRDVVLEDPVIRPLVRTRGVGLVGLDEAGAVVAPSAATTAIRSRWRAGR